MSQPSMSTVLSRYSPELIEVGFFNENSAAGTGNNYAEPVQAETLDRAKVSVATFKV